MSKIFSKFALAAGIVLAMAFTFSCSGDDGGTDEPSSSSAENPSVPSSSSIPSSSSTGGGANPSSSSIGGGLSSSVEGSSSSGNQSSSSSVVDNSANWVYGTPVEYGGKTYKTIIIGTQTWMQENLNYAVEGSKCYKDNAMNCTLYGRLYNWDAAMNACPAGWHLPNDEDWNILVNYAGGSKKLKDKSGWDDYEGISGNGTDDYGFSALPGGSGFSDNHAGKYGYWWSDSESNSNIAYSRIMFYGDEKVSRPVFYKSSLFSVRCVKNSPGGGSSSSVAVIYGTPVTYEGDTYPTVVIGTQTWFAKNLNYAVEGSVCYDNDPAYCGTYGRLYNWSTAMALPSSCNLGTCSSQIQTKHRGVCPSGWHIPSNAEWSMLETAVGGSSTAGTKLKAASGWSSGNGTNDYGFSALPGGEGLSGSRFNDVGDNGYWWSASEHEGLGGGFAYYRYMGYDGESTYFSYSGMSFLFSVRCLQD